MEEFNFTYRFEGQVWKSGGKGGWHFVSLPKDLSKEIRSIHQENEEGWGRLKANVTIKQTEFQSAIWFDKKHDTYLLPIKALIRKKEGITEGSSVEIEVELRL
jgi:hypothetical protein